MKIIERAKVPKKKYGKVIFDNPYMEPHERDTVFCLSQFGFDVEVISPSGVPKSNNPDLVMLGTYWEMKRPKEFNKSTLKLRFRKACQQSCGRAIFDLRDLKPKEIDDAVTFLKELFITTRGMRRIMILANDEKILDISK